MPDPSESPSSASPDASPPAPPSDPAPDGSPPAPGAPGSLPGVDRRSFIAATGIAAGVAAGASGATGGAARIATGFGAVDVRGTGAFLAAAAIASGQPAEGDGDAPDPAAVTPDDVRGAERILAIDLDEAERELVARGLEARRRGLVRLRERMHDHDLAPACTFDPRPAGFTPPVGASTCVPSAPGRLGAEPSADDLVRASIPELGHWLRTGGVTARRLAEVHLERIRRLEPVLEAVVTLTDALALEQADAADADLAAGRDRGPLHGIPYGAKDLFDTNGIATTWGATPYRDRVAERDAVVVARLREAGAVMLAKTTLGALAYGDIWFGGRTNNPWNLEQGSSGSSAGSAAGVAAGYFPFALGTETYGSIVSPSMRCGTTGLRPTFGRVARTGAMALCWSLDKIGPITRRVEDAAIVLAAIDGADAGDPSSLDVPYRWHHADGVRGLRVGVVPAWFEGRGASDVDRAALAALREVGPAAGLDVVEMDPPDLDGAGELLHVLEAEAAAAFAELTLTNRDDELAWQSPQAWPNTFRRTWFTSAVDLIQADRQRRRVAREIERWITRGDGRAARRGGDAGVHAVLSPSFAGGMLLATNFSGHPCLVLRAGFEENGLPRGVTLWGRLFDEGRLCQVGRLLEDALDVHERMPEVG